MGSVYESLLELHPELNVDAFTFSLKTYAGSERKTTGSHYTHRSLIRCLLDSALEPLLIDAMKKPEPEKALLALKVADLACGSGHFLIAAAHRIAKYLAIVRTGEGEPPVNILREALRDVVANCIYGVDINPLAVELCKVSLWLESLDPRKPLGFLDHRIKCGNSIIGATPELLAKGIPDDAFKPIEGDDPTVATSIRKKNKEERKGQQNLFTISEDRPDWREAATAYATWTSLPEDNIEQAAEKARQYETLVDMGVIRHQHELADLWTAAFFWPLTADTFDTVPTQDMFRRLRDSGYTLDKKTAGHVKALAEKHRFFHWHLEFPEVFMKGQGFDCSLGNPPWERINLEDRQFFAMVCPEIAKAPTAKRRALINSLKSKDPQLYIDYQEAQRFAASEIKWFQNSGKYPHLNQARLNTYVLFVELNMSLIAPEGLLGIIVPSGIATDDTSRLIFKVLTSEHRLVSLYDFENRKGIFPAVHRSYKFCLLTAGAQNAAPGGADYAFFLTDIAQLNESDRHFGLSSDDLQLLSPITGLCQTFRNKHDREIVLTIYNKIAPFIIQKENTDHWGSSDYLIMFRSDSSSHLYKSPDDLGLGYPLSPGPQYLTKGVSRFLPVWESKLMHQYDHRYATYEGVKSEDRREGKPREVNYSEKEHVQSAQPRYWVLDTEIMEIMQKRSWAFKWLLGYRDITNATNERTTIATVLPMGGASQPLNLFMPESTWQGVLWMVAMNSVVVDYIVRQSIGGLHLNITTCRQLPIISDLKLESKPGRMILNASCELVFTSAALDGFASDLGYDGPPFRWDEERRFKVRCELDALFFHLYGINRDDADYIIETFPIVKRKEIAQYGEHRTKNLILEIFDAMQRAKETGQPYRTLLNPFPGPLSAADGSFISMYQWDRDNWPTHIHPPHPDWDESILNAWFNVCQKQWNYLEQDQIFPWDGRETFIYALIPYLIQQKSGAKFEFYRDAASLASCPERLETLLLDDNLRNEYRQLIVDNVWMKFPKDHRIRPRLIREALQNKQIIQTAADSGSTTIHSSCSLPPLPNELKPFVKLILTAAGNLDKMQRHALESAEAAKMTFTQDELDSELKAFCAA
jgi:hypothetical protein